MPHPTLTEKCNDITRLSPGLVASHDSQPGNGVGLFWDKHTSLLAYLLTCPGPTRGNFLSQWQPRGHYRKKRYG